MDCYQQKIQTFKVCNKQQYLKIQQLKQDYAHYCNNIKECKLLYDSLQKKYQNIFRQNLNNQYSNYKNKHET